MKTTWNRMRKESEEWEQLKEHCNGIVFCRPMTQYVWARKKTKRKKERKTIELNSYTYTIRFSFISNTFTKKSKREKKHWMRRNNRRTNTSATFEQLKFLYTTKKIKTKGMLRSLSLSLSCFSTSLHLWFITNVHTFNAVGPTTQASAEIETELTIPPNAIQSLIIFVFVVVFCNLDDSTLQMHT